MKRNNLGYKIFSQSIFVISLSTYQPVSVTIFRSTENRFVEDGRRKSEYAQN